MIKRKPAYTGLDDQNWRETPPTDPGASFGPADGNSGGALKAGRQKPARTASRSRGRRPAAPSPGPSLGGRLLTRRRIARPASEAWRAGDNRTSDSSLTTGPPGGDPEGCPSTGPCRAAVEYAPGTGRSESSRATSLSTTPRKPGAAGFLARQSPRNRALRPWNRPSPTRSHGEPRSGRLPPYLEARREKASSSRPRPTTQWRRPH